MTEQRTPNGVASSNRANRPPSVNSLRHYRGRPSTTSASRRQSTDTTYETHMSQPSSPITYFPNPSVFTHPTPNSNNASSSAQPSRRPSTSTFQMQRSQSPTSHFRSPLPPSSSSSDAESLQSGDRTPRYRNRQLPSLEHPNRNELGNRLGSMSGRTISTPLPGGYGSSGNTGLGIGHPGFELPSRKKKDALSSPRRISTSQGPSHSTYNNNPHPQTAKVTHSPSSGLTPTPTNEAYYAQSQPSSASKPLFRTDEFGTQSRQGTFGHLPNSPRGSSAMGMRGYGHVRNMSGASGLGFGSGGAGMFVGPASPVGSVMRRIRKTASAVGLAVGRQGDYDGDDQLGRDHGGEEVQDEGIKSNGARVWYSSYVTIDWIHDAVKESSRVRKLRYKATKSIRGKIANSWDRFQGWLVVTIIGIVSAVIAFLIIRAEMALFDLKEGFCANSWGTAKRFCCVPHHERPEGIGEVCGDWIEWGQFLAPIVGEKGRRVAHWIWGGEEFIAYGIVALGLASLASCLTIYLSSSAHHSTSKDSTFLMPPPMPPADIVAGPVKSPNESQPLLQREQADHIPAQAQASAGSRKVMYYAAGSGIPEIKTILSGFVIHGYLGGWTLVTKSVGLALSVASGLSLGKEGPLVHISCCVGNIVSRLFTKFERNEAKRREILSAACAAGVSVAFGAPIGGVLFSLEEVSYYFPPKVMWRSFWCAAVAAITLKGLNPFGNKSLVLFEVSYDEDYHYWEYGIFILLGVFGGLYGAVFARLNILWSRHIRQGTWVKQHPIVEVLLVTALTTVVSFLNPYCRMGGTEFVASLFAECTPGSANSLCVTHPSEFSKVIRTAGIALLVKGCLTIITFGIKLPAGIFIPSLVVGACFGRIVGLSVQWLEHIRPDLPIFGVWTVIPGLYAMVGAAATLAGVTRTTVSLAVIMLELTGTLNYVVPVMLGVLVAKTVADGLEKKGIYDLVIDLNQLPYLDSKHEYLWGGRVVSEIADQDVPHLRADKPHTVRSLTGRLLQLARYGLADTGFPILTREGGGKLRVVGFLGMNELEHALGRLAGEPDAQLSLMPEDPKLGSSTLSIFSFAESYSDARSNPYDIARYIDKAPLTVQVDSPLELVQQHFVKLGARQLIVTDSKGVFRGMVTKKAWLNFLHELQEGKH